MRLLRPKYLLFGLIGLMFLYVVDHSERFLIDPADGEWMHIESFKWWLLPHAIAGACALILGPMQFSDRLRQRFIGVHRAVGRLYVTGVFIAAPLGVYIQYLNEPLDSRVRSRLKPYSRQACGCSRPASRSRSFSRGRSSSTGSG